MSPNLKAMLQEAPKEVREAFIDARAEIDENDVKALHEYDLLMEHELARTRKHAVVVSEFDKRNPAPNNKRVDGLQIK